MHPIFTVGTPTSEQLNATHEQTLAQEAQKFDDILQGDSEERYEMMVSKIYNTLYWFTMKCNPDTTRHVMLADCDVMLFPRNLRRFIDEQHGDVDSRMIFGSFSFGHGAIRDPQSKW